MVYSVSDFELPEAKKFMVLMLVIGTRSKTFPLNPLLGLFLIHSPLRGDKQESDCGRVNEREVKVAPED